MPRIKVQVGTPSSVHKAVLITSLLVGFALRLYRLGAESLWYDETVSAFLADQAVPELIAHTARDIHPPAYYLALHFWISLAGNTEFALAFLSLIFGVLLIPLTYRLARYLINPTAAAWTALIIAFSPFNIWYSQEVRMYTFGAAMGVMAAYCGLRALADSHAKRSSMWLYWFGYLISAAMGLYTLYYFVFLLIVLNLLFLAYTLRPRVKKTALVSLLVTNGLLVIVYSPWLPIAWRQAGSPPVPPWRNFSGLDLGPILLESWSALSFGQSVEPVTAWPLLLLALAFFVAGILYLRRLPVIPGAPLPVLSTAVFLVLYTFGPLLLIYLFSFVTPLYHIRYIFTYSPAFFILLGTGTAWFTRHLNIWAGPIAVGLLLAGSFYSVFQFHFNPDYRTDDYRAAVNFIQQHWQPGDAILVNAGYTYTAFIYYAVLPELEHQRLIPYHSPADQTMPLLLTTGTINGSPLLGWGDPQSDFYPMGSQDTADALDRLTQDYARLWVLRAYDTVTDPESFIRTWLAEHATLLENEVYAGESSIRAQGFLLSNPVPGSNNMVKFEDGMALAAWKLPDQFWQPGQTIHLQLWWLATIAPGVDYKMSLKLWTSAGDLAVQGRDEWPAGTLYRATVWRVGQAVYQPAQITLPPNLPPGQYWLNVELYHPDTALPLPRLDGRDPVVTLGPVNVQ